MSYCKFLSVFCREVTVFCIASVCLMRSMILMSDAGPISYVHLLFPASFEALEVYSIPHCHYTLILAFFSPLLIVCGVGMCFKEKTFLFSGIIVVH